MKRRLHDARPHGATRTRLRSAQNLCRCCFSARQNRIYSLRTFAEDDSVPPWTDAIPVLANNFKFLFDVAVDKARRAAQFPKPMVFAPPLATFGNKKQAREIDIVEGLVLSVECDQSPADARALLEQLLGTATVVVASGGEWMNPTTGEIEPKLHLHWRLTRPATLELKTEKTAVVPDWTELVKLKYLRDVAARLVGGDPSNKPICHPIRWPGSWHRKATPRLCEIVAVDLDRELDLDWALQAFGVPADKDWTKPEPASQAADDDDPHSESGRLDWADAVEQVISGKSYHVPLVSLSASFAACGIPQPAAHRLLDTLVVNSRPGDPERARRRDVERRKLRETVVSGYEKFTPTSEPLFDPWAPFIVPTFPFDVLPPALYEFTVTQSNNIGACPSAFAMATLCACSGALDHRFRLKIMRHGNWWAHPRLWCCWSATRRKRKPR